MMDNITQVRLTYGGDTLGNGEGTFRVPLIHFYSINTVNNGLCGLCDMRRRHFFEATEAAIDGYLNDGCLLTAFPTKVG
jgi:hypothetical protein